MFNILNKNFFKTIRTITWMAITVALFAIAASPAQATDFVPTATSIPAATPNIELTNLSITGGSIIRPAAFTGNRTIYWVEPAAQNGAITVNATAPTGATVSYTLDGAAQTGNTFNLHLSSAKLMSEIGIKVTDGSRTNNYYLDVCSQDPSSYTVTKQYYPGMKPYNLSTGKTLVLVDQLPGTDTTRDPAVLRFIADYLEGSQKNTSETTGPILARNPLWHSLHYHLSIWNIPTAGIIWNNQWTNIEWSQLAALFQTDPGIFMFANTKDSQGNPTDQVSPMMDTSYYGGYVMNIANDNYYNWLLHNIIDQCQTDNYDSVFLDSYTMDTVYSFTGGNYQHYDGTDMASYPDPQLGGMTWAQASEEFMARLTRDLNRAGIWSLPNLGNQRTTWDPVDYAYSNGGMFEQAFQTPTDARGDWQQDISRYIFLTNKDKILIYQSYAIAGLDDVKTRLYVTAAYHMCRGNYTYINQMPSGQSQASWYPEYEIGAMLGNATETAVCNSKVFDRWIVDPVVEQYSIGNSLYERKFQNGLVVINGDASGAAHSFTVPSDGHSYVSVTIQPGSGGTVPAGTGIAAITGAANYPLIKTPVSPGQTITLPGDGALILITSNDAVSTACELISATIGNNVPLTVDSTARTVTGSVDTSVSPALAPVVSSSATWALYSDANCTNHISSIPALQAGSNPAVYLKVTAADGVTSKIYTISLTGIAPSPVSVTGVTLNKTTDSIAVGGTNTLVAQVTPSNASNQNVTWTTSNSSIATVNNTGKVTAVAAGTATITATTVDGGFTAACTVTVTGGGGPGPTPVAPTITTSSFPGGTVGTNYSQAIAVTGDAPITWSIDSGALPGGLTLQSNGVISGTPTSAGTFSFAVKATNAAGANTKTFVVTIAAAPVNTYLLTVTAGAGGTVAGSAGDFASGAQVSVSATPNSDYSFSGWTASGVTLTDPSANTISFAMPANAVALTANFRYNGGGGDTTPVAPTIATSALPGGTVGTNYSQAIAVSGDAPITWTIDSGALPGGLTLNSSSGVISGNPTSAGTFNFAVKAMNTAGADTKTFAVTIAAAPVNTYLLTVIAGTGGEVAGSTGDFAPGAQISVSATPNSGYIFSGWTASGVTLTDPSANAIIFAMPANAVALTANFRYNGGGGDTTPVAPIITTSTLPGGTVGTNYSQTLAATGDAPITWTIDSGALPGGLTLNSSSGAITGTPTSAGTFNFAVKAANTAGADTKTFAVTIAAAPATTYPLTVTAGTGGAVTGSAGNYAPGTQVSVKATSNPGYSFSGWTASGVTLNNSTASSITFTMPANAVTLTANFRYNSSGGGSSSSSPSAAKLNKTTLSFDQNTAGAKNQDISVTLTPGGYSVQQLQNGSYTLVKGTDYTVNGNRYTINAAYLATLPAGSQTITFKMSGGTNPQLTVNITGSNVSVSATAPATVSAPGQPAAIPVPSTTATQPAGNPFKDVRQGDWFYNDTQYVYGKGLMTGTSKSLFSPNMTTTRAMVVTILYRNAGSPDASGLVNPFKDVAAGKWYTDGVKWAANNGLVSGNSNGKFDPNGNITREQLAAIFYRYGQSGNTSLPGIVPDKQFSDWNSISNYAKNAVKELQRQGLVSGKTGNLFDPQGQATRAEVAAMIHRLIK